MGKNHASQYANFGSLRIAPAFTQLYILPVSHEDEFKLTEGCFFTCEEIKQNPEKFSNELRIECERLQMVAQVWKEFK